MTVAGETPQGHGEQGGGGKTETKKERGIADEERGQAEKKESKKEEESDG